jgi:hypothetical protein
VCHPLTELSVIRHEPDNRFLECALAVGADFIVTVNTAAGHFDRKNYQDAAVVRPGEFLERSWPHGLARGLGANAWSRSARSDCVRVGKSKTDSLKLFGLDERHRALFSPRPGRGAGRPAPPGLARRDAHAVRTPSQPPRLATDSIAGHLPMTVVVADTSPLNYLALIGSIDLLHLLYGSVLVPQQVVLESTDLAARCPISTQESSRRSCSPNLRPERSC